MLVALISFLRVLANFNPHPLVTTTQPLHVRGYFGRANLALVVDAL